MTSFIHHINGDSTNIIIAVNIPVAPVWVAKLKEIACVRNNHAVGCLIERRLVTNPIRKSGDFFSHSASHVDMLYFP